MISVITPILNEAKHLEAWGRNVARFASQVVVLDMGSKDGSQEIVESFGFELHHFDCRPHAGTDYIPYSWEEGKVRNQLIMWARCPWIVNQDADELWGQDFFDALPELKLSKRPMIRFSQYRFWLSPNLIRTRSYKTLDEYRRFYPGGVQVRMFRKAHIWYKQRGNHAPLSYRGLPKYANRFLAETRRDIPFFHFHLDPKPMDNRLADYARTGVSLQSYFGPHPEEVKHYPDLRWLQ